MHGCVLLLVCICVAIPSLYFVLSPVPMTPWQQDALVSLTYKLKVNIKMIVLGDILEKPAGGFMNEAEALSVKAKIGEAEQVGQVITILRGKGDKEFTTFCKMLRTSGYEMWAQQLELEADKLQTNAGIFSFLAFCCTDKYNVAASLYTVFTHAFLMPR